MKTMSATNKIRNSTVPLLGPPPPASSPAVRRSMKSNRARNTAPELRLRRSLWAAGLKGYRLGWRKAPGRPDIAYPGRYIAIFVHGCFWHRCPHCNPALPQRNPDFWQRKFIRNQERDARKTQELKAAGWQVIELWECQINRHLDFCLSMIRQAWETRPATRKFDSTQNL